MDNPFTKVGNGPNLVFLHGWRHDKHSWDGIVGKLKEDFTCWQIDLPAFGANSERLSDVSPFGYANWVEDLLKKQGVDSFSLVGHSFGGRIAAIIASRNQHVDHVVLYATPVFNIKPAKAKILSVFASKFGIHNVPYVSDKLRSKDYKEAGALKEIFLEAVKVDLTQQVKQIAAPTLLLWGENDLEVPFETAERLHSLIRRSTLYQIPKTGHNAHLENPVLFAGKVKSFLETSHEVGKRT